MGIRLSFVKTSEFQRGRGSWTPKPPSVRHCLYELYWLWEMRRRCYIDIIDKCRTPSPPLEVTQRQTTTEDGRLPTSSSPSKWSTARRELSADVISVRTAYYWSITRPRWYSTFHNTWLDTWPHILKPLTPELNPFAQRCLTRFLLGILLLKPCISLIYAWKTNKYTNYSFSLLIMYGSSYMFRHYIAIFRERF
jgi:hypothetical protein